MSDASKSKRLDEIEQELSPKQWGIRIADEMRSYPSQYEFLNSIAKSTYRQSIFIRPYYALAQQAKECWPGNDQTDLQNAKDAMQKRHMEFHALKTLISNINAAIGDKAVMRKLKIESQLNRFHTLILKECVVHTGVDETTSKSQALLRLTPGLEDWADDSAELLADGSVYKTAVKLIQERYFSGHLILYVDIEIAFEKTNQTVRDAIAEFNKFAATRIASPTETIGNEQHEDETANIVLSDRNSRLAIDIDGVEKRAEIFAEVVAAQWLQWAKFHGAAELLREKQKYEDFVWKHGRQEMGLEPR
jgi:hypothetical protein